VDAEQEEVVWNKVENATSYVVEIISGEESYKIDAGNATRYSLKEYKGELTIKVTPVAKGYNSPQAATVTYNKTSLPTPGNIRVAEGRLIWDAVRRRKQLTTSASERILIQCPPKAEPRR